MTLALLLTAATGAWADDLSNKIWKPGDTFNIGAAWLYDDDKGTSTVYHSIDEDNTVPAINDWTYDSNKNQWKIPGFIKVDKVDFSGDVISLEYSIELYLSAPEGKLSADVKPIGLKIISGAGTKESPYTLGLVYEEAPAVPDVEVTTNAAEEGGTFTEAWFDMPTGDVTAEYELVRDMQDETNPVTFSGLPTNDEPIIVKKGSDGKYQPAEALTIQLIDPLAAAEAQNIIQADGITIKVLVGAVNELGAIDFDQDNPITLEAFLADMKPGYYWIKAEQTDENSPYDGTVYSSQFTAVEKYDLTVKPANDFSKGKVESVTVGSGSVTIDANTGEATKTGITPDTEVKIKAKRGYVIDKVEVKKTSTPN